MAKVRIGSNQALELDGDLLALLETLYREISLKSGLQATFEDMMRSIQGIVAQMSEDDRQRYLVESLFLNTVTYENEILDAYAHRLSDGPKRQRVRVRGRAS